MQPGRGSASPPRNHSALSSCVEGGHEIWWRVQADGPDAALLLLPGYVAARTRPVEVREVPIP